MIWFTRRHDRARTRLETTTCPVLAFTPEVESALRWFQQTHELVVDGTRAWWRRTALPAAGGAGEQDAWLSDALDYLRGIYDDLVRPRPKTTK